MSLQPPTLLTNLQRGNTQTEIPLPYGGGDITFYTLAGQGELASENILPGTIGCSRPNLFNLCFNYYHNYHMHSRINLPTSGSVDTADESGLTGLMWAAGYGQLSSARLLLQAGADYNYRGNKGQRPLHLAAAYGHHDLVKLLLNHGADPNACEDVS